MKAYEKILVISMLSVLSFTSYAGCHDLLIGQLSHHRDETYEDDGVHYEHNNDNELLGCITDNDHVIAVFENSYEDTAMLLAHKWSNDTLSKYITPYVVLGVALGYEDHMAHIGAFSPYGFVGLDIHPESKRYGLMISTVGVTTTIGLRFAWR